MARRWQVSDNLEKRIAAALANGNAGSEELAELVWEVEAAIVVAEQNAKTEYQRTFDLTYGVEISKASADLRIAEVVRDRLNAGLPKLRDKLAEATAREVRERWHADADRVEARVKEAAQRYIHYPVLIAQLIDILDTEEIDQEVSRINGGAPDGEHRRLSEVELVARGITGFTRDAPSIAKTCQLPDWEHSSQMAWPPAQVPLGVLAASMVPAFDTRYNQGRWYEVIAERDEHQRRDSARVDADNARRAQEREDAENAENRQRAAAIQH
jgi:hypothetical protein